MNVCAYTGHELAAALPTLLDSAKNSIRLAIYQLSPDTSTSTARMRALWMALHAAPHRGVQCAAVLHCGSRNLPGMASANMAACQLEQAGWNVRLKTGGQIMHAKCLIVDTHAVLIGSHNWTESGLYQNAEASVLLYDGLTAEHLTVWHSRLMTEA